MPWLSADVLVEPGYALSDFVDGVTVFADSTERRARPLFYDDVLGQFQDHDEDGAPIYTPDQLGGVLREYAADPAGETVTVRCYEPEVNLTDYDEHELPPHTAFTYVPGDGKLEVSAADETLLDASDVVETYFSGIDGR